MKKIELTYIGRRLVAGDQVYQMFTDGKKEHPFRGICRLVLGGVYECEIGSNGMTMNRRPEAVRYTEPTKAQVVSDELVSTFYERRRTRKTAEREVAKWKEFPRLAEMLDGASYTECRMVVEAIVDRLVKKQRRSLK